MRRAALALLSLGCTGDEPISPHPCASETMGVEVAPPFGDYGDLSDVDELWLGDPPQGGAPYSPFRVRISGPDALSDGVDVRVVVTEDGVVIADNTIFKGLVCANVGENAGRWVGSEVHLRYDGFDDLELEGRDVTVEVSVTGGETDELFARVEGRVTLVLD